MTDTKEIINLQQILPNANWSQTTKGWRRASELPTMGKRKFSVDLEIEIGVGFEG